MLVKDSWGEKGYSGLSFQGTEFMLTEKTMAVGETVGMCRGSRYLGRQRTEYSLG